MNTLIITRKRPEGGISVAHDKSWEHKGTLDLEPGGAT